MAKLGKNNKRGGKIVKFEPVECESHAIKVDEKPFKKRTQIQFDLEVQDERKTKASSKPAVRQRITPFVEKMPD